jgi:hypothetical protein
MRSNRELRLVAPFTAAATCLLLAACEGSRPAPEPAATAAIEDSAHHLRPADPELAVACDTVHQLLAAAMADAELHGSWGPFTGSLHGDPRHGCTFSAADSLPPDLPARPLDRVWGQLETRGWQPVHAYSADGPEGRLAGVRRGTILCVLQHFWDAGSDDERAAVWTSPMWYQVRAECSRDVRRDTAQ